MSKLFSTKDKRFLRKIQKTEKELNDFLVNHWNFIFPNLTLIKSEFQLEGDVRSKGTAGRIDILAFNSKSKKIVVFELKNDLEELIEQLPINDKTKLKNNADLGLGYTHEEPLTELMSHYISSHKDLPAYVYQFQTKFRNELRAKSGLLRVREFVMKDLYSFTKTPEELEAFYEKAAEAYLNVFRRAGIGDVTYRTFASGGVFSKFSDEFQTVCKAGEDVVYLDRKKKIAVNKEVYEDDILEELGLNKKDLEEAKAIEVGNIFKLGTKYSSPFDLKFKDKDGQDKNVVMGCYGLGLARIMGAIVEVCRDEKGIIWPEAAAPFRIHLINLTKTDEDSARTLEIYDRLRKTGLEILFDDRDISAGEKFAESDLLGIPFRIVISEKTLAKESVEIKKRSEKDSALVEISQIFGLLK